MHITSHPRSSVTTTVHSSNKGNCTVFSSLEYAKNMHEILDDLCSGIDVPARASSLESSEEVSTWIASLVCAKKNKGVKNGW